ncbi:MAG: VWA domain-containing protein [Actinobacteria bacterium]|nr:VWA domain-containing protein [Actinomycetota bacterium]
MLDFFEPQRLWLLAAVAGLAVTYVVMQSRRKKYAVRFTNLALLSSVAPKSPGWRRHIPAFLFLAALSTLVVGFADPAKDQKIPRERATIILAIDTSLSMEATDVQPNRLGAAKTAAKTFVDILPSKINVGLLSFNGNATLKVPPTTDRERLKQGIDALKLDQATAIGEALFASLDAIAAVPPDDAGTAAPARIVLLSDGKTTVGRPNEVGAKAAKDLNIAVSTIAFGTDEGTIRIPQENASVNVPVDGEALQQIADTTGGKFFNAATADQLKSVYEDIGSSVGYTTEMRSIAGWFIGAALLILAMTSALSLVWFSRLP